MLTHAMFRGFKALADVAIDLEPLTVLVGPNAAGKSTVLEGIDCALGQFPRGNLLLDFDRLRTRSGAPDVRFQVRTSDGLVYGHVLQPTPQKGVSHKLVRAKGEVAPVPHPSTILGSTEGDEPARAAKLRFSLENLVADSVPRNSEPGVASDGQGLASALAYVIGLRDGRIEAIEEALRKVVPIARRVRCVKAPAGAQLADRFEIEIAGLGWLPPSALSEGTLLALALLTVLHAPSCPKIVLLDDVDRALHPRAQASVIAVIRGVQQAAEGIQVVCTSHSPYLLDCLEPQEVRIMKVTDQGLAQCRKLTDHPDWERWKGSMRPGEFWGSVGEDWIS
jgi:predicted ATPase